MLGFGPHVYCVLANFHILYFLYLWLPMILSFFQLHQPLGANFRALTQRCGYRVPSGYKGNMEGGKCGLPWVHYTNQCLLLAPFLKEGP